MALTSGSILSGVHGGSNVNFTSALLMPSMFFSASSISCIMKSAYGHPGNVKVKTTSTSCSLIFTSYIRPRLTMSMPKSGSTTLVSAFSTSSSFIFFLRINRRVRIL